MAGTACFTFDDWFATDWYDAIPIFRAFDARATFFVGKIHELDDEAIRKLHALEDAGHEIAYHTRDHVNIKFYTNDPEKLSRYIPEQIERGIAEHREKGFDPKTFSYPFFKWSGEVAENLRPQFILQRCSGAPKLPPNELGKRVFKSLPDNGQVAAMGMIDTGHTHFLGLEHFDGCCRLLAREGGTGFFVGHRITLKKTRSHVFHSTQADLARLLAIAQDAGLAFKTAAEFAAISTDQAKTP